MPRLLRLTTTDTVLAMPSNGKGSPAPGNQRGASTLTYTKTTVASNTIDFSGGAPAAVVGGVFISSEGFWGIIRAVAVGAGNPVTVDYWRDPTQPNHSPQTGTTPASGGSTCWHGAQSEIADERFTYIKKIVTKVAGAASVEIVDVQGTVVETFLLTSAPVGPLVDYTDASPEGLRGLKILGPFRARLTAAAGGCEIIYD